MDFGGQDVLVSIKAMTAVAPDVTWVHCSIHREALAAKRMPDSLKDVLDTTLKMVNFVKASPLNSDVFCSLVIKGQSIDTFF